MKDIFGTKNEILLGINPCIYGLNYHDPSVVVFINGEVVFGIEEERCNRIKGSKGMFPSSAIKQSLIHCNLTWDDIDAIVIGYDPALWMDRLEKMVQKMLVNYGNKLTTSATNDIMIIGWCCKYLRWTTNSHHRWFKELFLSICEPTNEAKLSHIISGLL